MVPATGAPTSRCRCVPSPNLTIDTLPEVPEMLLHRVGIALDQGMVGPVKLLKSFTEEAILKTEVK